MFGYKQWEKIKRKTKNNLSCEGLNVKLKKRKKKITEKDAIIKM